MTDKQKLKEIKRMIENKDYAECEDDSDWVIHLENILSHIEELIDEKKEVKSRSKKS